MLGVLTAVILGAVLEGRGAADRIDALRREGAAALRAEETSLVRRYERATGLSWAVASLATVIGTTSVVAVFPGDLFAAVMVILLTVLVVSLSSFVSTTSRDARVALQRENDRRRHREVRVLRTVESRWRSTHRPQRQHGTRRVVVAVATPSAVLGVAGLYALPAQRTPAMGLLLLVAGITLPVVTLTVVLVVRAGALQRTFERVGPWLGFLPIWLLVVVVAIAAVGVLGGSRSWFAIAAVVLLVVHFGAGWWAFRGLFWQQGVFRHLRPHVANRVAARADALERPAETKPPRKPRSRLVREWQTMTGQDARDDDGSLV
ncbi:hypothetical protein [uncultured Pseudokineococcus sp.]|uniref:hypothetical protein n=1 Tax=uncultured Pseudokineococcus sp. TaxID=1642928 RepID=UPI0026077411|nr:hypothetical protein [uncultured Pseudokineococcus sp.]